MSKHYLYTQLGTLWLGEFLSCCIRAESHGIVLWWGSGTSNLPRPTLSV